MFRRLTIVFVLALGLFSTAEAGWDEGAAAYKRGDYETALREWRPVAEQGDALAQYNLGAMYEHGWGVPQDHEKAAYWYVRALLNGSNITLAAIERIADQNTDLEPIRVPGLTRPIEWDAVMLLIGGVYDTGQLVPRNFVKAMKWYRRAFEKDPTELFKAFQKDAEKKDMPAAQYLLGTMYEMGDGLPKDQVEAGKWYSRSAELGVAHAQYRLGVLYHVGRGVPQDFISAHLWLNLAAAQGVEGAVEEREAVANKMAPDLVAEAQRLAREWRPKAMPKPAVPGELYVPPRADILLTRPSGDFLFNRGDIHLQTGEWAEALEDFNLALEQQPDHRGALMGRALVYLNTGHDEEAEAELTYLIDYLNKNLEPDDPTGLGTLAAAHANLGILYDRQGRYEDALAEYVKALETDAGAVEGPNSVELILYEARPSTVRDRATYIYEQLQLPEEERLLRLPDKDERQPEEERLFRLPDDYDPATWAEMKARLEAIDDLDDERQRMHKWEWKPKQ